MKSPIEVYESAREEYRRRRRFSMWTILWVFVLAVLEAGLGFDSPVTRWRFFDYFVSAFDLAVAFFLYIQIRKKFPPL